MRIGGKILCFVLLLVSFVTVHAADNENYADTLHQIGLFAGTENGYDLDSPLAREQSATMIVRLRGAEKTALATTYDAFFTDVKNDRWSFPYIMYCYKNGITKGTGSGEFTPATSISAEEFTTFVLRLLGYRDASPVTAFSTAVTSGLFGSEYVRRLEDSEKFLRDDMVFITYRSLKTKTTDGVIMARVLANEGIITQAQADKFDVYKTNGNIDDILDGLIE